MTAEHGGDGRGGAEPHSAHQNFSARHPKPSIPHRSTYHNSTYKMAPTNIRKRKHDEISKPKHVKKVRKQQRYSSPSSADEADEFPAVNLADSDSDLDQSSEALSDTPATTDPNPAADSTDNASSATDSDDSSTSEPSNPNHTKLSKQKSKRNDPTAFASSISAILNSKLSTSKRSDPVLARSSTAAEANASITNGILEKKAKSKLREDKKEALEKGRVKDVLLGTDVPGGAGSVEEMMEEEKRLRKTAQRGVVKLFNAVRQAQVRAEEAAREAKGVTRGRREEKMKEMSKKGFLELVAGGGTSGKGVGIGKAEIGEA